MKQFAITAAAAAAVMMMNPAFAADAAYEADLCVIGAGASGTAAAWAAAEKGMKVITLENLKTVESTLSQIRRRRARGTSGLWPSSP